MLDSWTIVCRKKRPERVLKDGPGLKKNCPVKTKLSQGTSQTEMIFLRTRIKDGKQCTRPGFFHRCPVAQTVPMFRSLVSTCQIFNVISLAFATTRWPTLPEEHPQA